MISVNVKGIYLPKDEYDAGRGIDGRILEKNRIGLAVFLKQERRGQSTKFKRMT